MDDCLINVTKSPTVYGSDMVFVSQAITHAECSLKLKQDCFLQKEARVCVSNAFVLEDSMFK